MAHTVCYRAARYREALWKIPNLTEGRFHRSGEAPTQYFALHPLTPLAEVIRRTGMQRGDVQAAYIAGELRTRTWASRIELEDIPRITFDDVASFGITESELVDDDRSACQELGTRLRADGARGLIYPSSALPGTESVVLFGPRIETPYLGDPMSPAIDIPTSVTAEDGTAIPDLIARIRLLGEPHAGLAAVGATVFHEPDYALGGWP